jgi:hypothetical protein
VLLISSLCSLSVRAQQRTKSAPPQPLPLRQSDVPEDSSQKETSQVSTESADVAITATVTARELRFEVVPNPVVEFSGKPRRDTVWDAERESLPRPVEPGVTYRNIGIRLKIASRFADIDRIVAEALGEVPITDEAPPSEKTTPQTNSPQTPAPSTQPNGGSPQ